MKIKSAFSLLHLLHLPRLPATVLVLAALLSLRALASAAPPEASWSGALRDNSGTPIVGVSVILSNGSGKSAYTARTQADGEFAFLAIATGTYKVAVVTQQGIYQAAQSVVVTEGVALKTNLQLSIADASLVLGQGQTAPASQGSGGEHLCDLRWRACR
jgi:hypothetical protein